MKILTLNTWMEKGPWQKRWEVTFDSIDCLQPDVIAFQEIFKPEWAKEVQTRTAYASLVHLPGSMKSGLCILSKFTVLSFEEFELKAQSLNSEPKRFLLHARLRSGVRDFSIFNTHLTWRLDEGDLRCRQVDEILEIIEKQKNENVIVCGDFNAADNTEELRKMITAGFKDTFKSVYPGSTKLTWDNTNPYAASSSVRLPDRRIDFIFARGFEDPISSDIVLDKPNENGVFASDHYGVLTEF